MLFTPVTDPKVEPRILAHTRALGIPRDPVQIARYAEEEITDIFEFQRDDSENADRELVPLTGGVKIQSADGRNGSACSIGFILISDNLSVQSSNRGDSDNRLHGLPSVTVTIHQVRCSVHTKFADR